MGYSTRFELEVSDDNDGYHECPTCGHSAKVDHFKSIGELSGYGDMRNGFDDIKWYHHDEHMLEYSKLYPEVLFTLHGEGEETGDIWTTYYKNGKCQEEQAEIQIASFDPAKLK